MLRACSSATNMSTDLCCSTWNEPIGTPNCLRVLRYSTVSSCRAAIAPTASAAQRRDRLVHHALQHREARVGTRQHRLRPDAHGRQRDVGGTHAVLGGIAAPGHAVGVGGDQEQADAAALGAAARDARRHDQLVGAVAVQDDALLAFQGVAALAVGARGGGGVGEVVARLPLLVRQRQRQPALGDGRHQLARSSASLPAWRSAPPASTTVAR